MPSLIDIRRRIRSVRNTQQITKAMKMVSAAKLRRAQDRVIASRPYGAALRALLGDVAAAAGGDERVAAHPLLARRPENRVQLVLITSDKGLAAAFNSNLIKAAVRFGDERPGASIDYELIGRKGRDFFRKRKVSITADYVGLSARAETRDAQQIAKKLMDRFENEEIDAVYVLYNEFKSVVAQKVIVSRVLPVELPERADSVDFIFEQPPIEMLQSLLPRYVETELYRALLESAAAEHAARMTAMDAATSNASEMIDTLTLYMNRVRQASITKEIIEVVSGAAAAE
ncbi:MAG: ATP synthase F1 subunit gamma [Bryobacteraceae bacterium]